MPAAGFEPAIPAIQLLQIQRLRLYGHRHRHMIFQVPFEHSYVATKNMRFDCRIAGPRWRLAKVVRDSAISVKWKGLCEGESRRQNVSWWGNVVLSEGTVKRTETWRDLVCRKDASVAPSWLAAGLSKGYRWLGVRSRLHTIDSYLPHVSNSADLFDLHTCGVWS